MKLGSSQEKMQISDAFAFVISVTHFGWRKKTQQVSNTDFYHSLSTSSIDATKIRKYSK